VQDAIIDEPDRDWNMAALAQAGNTTERHLLRLFLEHARVSPLQYLQAIRLERARQALAHGANVTQAAEFGGFRSDLQMRRAWSRQWGGSPRDVLKAGRTRRVVRANRRKARA
jgi:transcriptional regulator GlxA family with amidase domain